MLLQCCTQYVSKFGKLSNGHMTGKGQSSFQFPRRAVLKNVQTTGQLHSFPMLIRLCSKSSKVGFSIMWTENFQMFKLGLEKAQEPEIKLPTFAESYRKQENSRKTSTSVSMTTLKPLTVWIITNCESESEVAQSCPTLCDPMDYSLPGFSIHGIFQARVLEWVAISFSRGSSQPRDRTQVFHNASRCFTLWATRGVDKALTSALQNLRF